MIDDPISLFTAILTIATIGMWYVMWKTLKAANRTAEDTRLSITVSMEANRGVMTYSTGIRRGNKFHYSFKNIGNGPAFITGFIAHATGVDQFTPRPKPPGKDDDIFSANLAIESGKELSTYINNNAASAFDSRAIDIPESWTPETHPIMFVQYLIVYKSIFGSKYIHAFACEYTIGAQMAKPITDNKYSFEIRTVDGTMKRTSIDKLGVY